MTGFGRRVKPYFWLIDNGTVGANMHLAFTVDASEEVDVFYRATLDAGAVSRDAPAMRLEYHPDYYGGPHHRPARHQPRGRLHRPVD